MKTLNEVKSILRKHAKDLQRKHGLSSMAVFGSLVHENASERSDIDILANFDRPIGLLELVSAEKDLSDLLGEKVDLIIRRSVRRELRERILSEAVPV